jgi:hypothetical protein
MLLPVVSIVSRSAAAASAPTWMVGRYRCRVARATVSWRARRISMRPSHRVRVIGPARGRRSRLQPHRLRPAAVASTRSTACAAASAARSCQAHRIRSARSCSDPARRSDRTSGTPVRRFTVGNDRLGGERETGQVNRVSRGAWSVCARWESGRMLCVRLSKKSRPKKSRVGKAWSKKNA